MHVFVCFLIKLLVNYLSHFGGDLLSYPHEKGLSDTVALSCAPRHLVQTHIGYSIPSAFNRQKHPVAKALQHVDNMKQLG